MEIVIEKEARNAYDNPASYTKEDLIEAVANDLSLSPQQRIEIVNRLQKEDQFSNLEHGVIGGALGYSLSKFLKLGKTSQLLLSIAGFGAGKLLLNHGNANDNTLNYNKKNNTYEVKY